MKAAVFLERDGVINEAQLVNGHQKTPLHMDEFRIRPDVRPGLNRLKEAGFLVIITTNQPGLANGRLCRSELDLMHTMLYRALPIDDILMCPHAEGDNCHCHKPESGLFTEAAFKWHLDMDLSFVISDKEKTPRPPIQPAAPPCSSNRRSTAAVIMISWFRTCVGRSIR